MSFTPKCKTKKLSKIKAKLGHRFLLELLQEVVEAVEIFILAIFSYFLSIGAGKGTQGLCGEKQLLPWKVV